MICKVSDQIIELLDGGFRIGKYALDELRVQRLLCVVRQGDADAGFVPEYHVASALTDQSESFAFEGFDDIIDPFRQGRCYPASEVVFHSLPLPGQIDPPFE